MELLIWKMVVTLLLAMTAYLFTLVASRLVTQRVMDLRRQYNWRNFITVLMAVLFFCGAAYIWAADVFSLTVGLGIAASAAILALHEPILCLAGWLFITLRRPFDVGDRIRLGVTRGEVRDVRLFHTDLIELSDAAGGEQLTGRIVHLPNSALFRTALIRHSRGFEFVWDEPSVVLTFDSNWARAREVMLRIAQRQMERYQHQMAWYVRSLSREQAARIEPMTPAVFMDWAPAGIRLSARYLVPLRECRTMRDEFFQNLLRECAQESGIQFAASGTAVNAAPQLGPQ